MAYRIVLDLDLADQSEDDALTLIRAIKDDIAATCLAHLVSDMRTEVTP